MSNPEGEWMDLYGPCPFLDCLETSVHSHSICPACGAVRHGNLMCDTCRAYHRCDLCGAIWALDAKGVCGNCGAVNRKGRAA